MNMNKINPDSKPIKIAILAPYVGKVNRGAESFVIEITKQIRSDFDVDVFTISCCQEISENVIVADVKKNILFKLHEKLFNNSELYRKLNWKIYYTIPDIIYQKKFSKKVYKMYFNQKKYDIIYPNNGIWGVKYAKKSSGKVIYTGHGGFGKGEELILKSDIDAYVCLTHRQLDWARKFSEKILFIPNGVDMKKFCPIKKTENKNVISVGALTRAKRHKLTIDAIKLLPDFHLTILGKGELEKELRHYADKTIPGRYEIKSVNYDEICNYYNEANVFVLPSDAGEAFGIVYLEAMASNLPVVAQDDEIRREIIGEAGILCDVTNAHEYAAAIKEAYERDWGNLPVRQADKFSWESVGSKYKFLFNKIVNGSGSDIFE